MAERDADGRSLWPWLVPAALIAAGAIAWWVSPGVRVFAGEAARVIASGEQTRVEAWVAGFGPWGLVVVLLLMAVQPLLVVVPSTLMMVVAVIAYGAVAGGVLAWGGSLLAALVGYGLGRALGPVTVDRLIGEDTERNLRATLERYGFWAVLVFRVSPLLSTDAISVVAGLLRMKPLAYLVATGLGFLPLAGAIAWLGSDFERLERGLLWGSLASLAVFVGWVLWDRRRRDDDGAGDAG